MSVGPALCAGPTDIWKISPRSDFERENVPARCRWHLVWVGLIFVDQLSLPSARVLSGGLFGPI